MPNYIIYTDTETTGTNPKIHGIISLAMLIEENDKIIDEGYWEMRPTGRTVDPKALEVNGYKRSEISEFPPWEQVRLEVKEFMEKYIDPRDKQSKFIACGYNVDFDISFLESWWESCNDPYLFSYIKRNIYIDPFKSLGMLQWAGKLPAFPRNNLETVCKGLDISLENAHNSLDDIRATRLLAHKIRSMI